MDPAEYRQPIAGVGAFLEMALKPDDSKAKTAYAKFQKRKRDRAELVDAARDAFVPKWVGQETRERPRLQRDRAHAESRTSTRAPRSRTR